jgi:hypothetical protein
MHCEKCDVEVTRIKWRTDLNSKTHIKNDPDQTASPLGDTKLCEKCNVQLNRAVGVHIYI